MAKWIPKKENWLGTYREKEAEPKSQEYGITVYSIKCKGCGSFDVTIARTMPWEGNRRIRYYKCKGCRNSFKVTEIRE